ncbi:MAG: hypothetical protein IK024_06610, partial [Treponema sp.]|nr:hypothetical protein [Treponema sp.]
RESDELNNFHSCKRREAAYDGKRTNKYTDITETLYFNSFWSYYIDGSTRSRGGAVSKHIFLGETRLATVINDYRNVEDKTFGTEKNHIYFYHSDHLGSAQLVTDHNGDEYQRLEYTPYGETWVDIKKIAVEQAPMNFMFSAKELDKETGFYYYGARYLDPKYSRWISADPAMNTGEYFPQAPVNDEAKKHNGNLPGMGGVFNHINGNLYHYAGNNPIKYTDPDGRFDGISLNLVPEGDPNGTKEQKRDFNLNKGFEKVATFWGQMTVAIHGNENGVYINHKPISIKKLAKMIKTNPRYEEAKKEAQKKGEKMEIILLSCNTGKQPKNGKLPVGQQLANELADEDVIVKAPDKYVLPARLDSFGPGYELSTSNVIDKNHKPAPRRFIRFEYKPQKKED